jgi:hypothetical protein
MKRTLLFPVTEGSPVWSEPDLDLSRRAYAAGKGKGKVVPVLN